MERALLPAVEALEKSPIGINYFSNYCDDKQLCTLYGMIGASAAITDPLDLKRYELRSHQLRSKHQIDVDTLERTKNFINFWILCFAGAPGPGCLWPSNLSLSLRDLNIALQDLIIGHVNSFVHVFGILNHVA